jgi:hypothetical protein
MAPCGGITGRMWLGQPFPQAAQLDNFHNAFVQEKVEILLTNSDSGLFHRLK